MLVRAKKIVALSVMTLVAAVISLPVVSLAATSPVVTVLSPLAQGLRAPVKVALDAGGNIYVADQRIGGVVRYDTYGTQLQTIRTSAIPSGITFAQDGTLLVSQASFVARYDVSTGLETGRLTGGQLQSPVGIAVDNVTGFSYVADSVANQVEVYTASGQFVKAFAKGSLSSPTGISFEKISRQLVVADTLNHRIQFFDVDGNLVKIIGTSIPSGANSFYTGKIVPMQFDAPVAVAFE
ncbi:MAG: NHL repeat-containing protein, partial [Desulfuromonadales bacterium]